MRAPGCDNIRFAVFTSVERQVLAHDSNGCRFAGQQLGSQRNGLPEIRKRSPINVRGLEWTNSSLLNRDRFLDFDN